MSSRGWSWKRYSEEWDRLFLESHRGCDARSGGTFIGERRRRYFNIVPVINCLCVDLLFLFFKIELTEQRYLSVGRWSIDEVNAVFCHVSR